MKHLIAIISILLIPSIASATERRAAITASKVSWNTRRQVIASYHYGKSFWRLPAAKRTGIDWAVRRSYTKLDPRCSSHVLVWNDSYIRAGIRSYYRKKKAKRKAVIRPVVKTVHHHHKTVVNKTIVRKTIVNKTIVRKTIIVKPPAAKVRVKSPSYKEPNRFDAWGYVFNENLGGKEFSRGGGFAFHSHYTLYRKIFLLRFELDLNMMFANYMSPGRYYGMDNTLNVLAGKKLGQTQVIAGLSVDFLAGRDNYGGFKVDVSEGAGKALLMVRHDTHYFSIEARAALGGGSQKAAGTSALLRFSGKLQLEFHLGKYVDLVAFTRVRYDRLSHQDVVRDNTTVAARGLVRINFPCRLITSLGFEGGVHTGNLGTMHYMGPVFALGTVF